MAFYGNMWDSPDLATFAKQFCKYSPDSPTFAKSFCEDSPDWRVWRVLRKFGKFSECRLDCFIHEYINMLFVHKTTYLIMYACTNICQVAWQVLARLADIHHRPFLNVTHLAKFARVMSESGKCGASGHCLQPNINISYVKFKQRKK